MPDAGEGVSGDRYLVVWCAARGIWWGYFEIQDYTAHICLLPHQSKRYRTVGVVIQKIYGLTPVLRSLFT